MSNSQTSVKMIDVGEKPMIIREAIASGKIFLHSQTISSIQEGQIKKGDPLQVSQIAAINAAKMTPSIIPLCHQIPLTYVGCEFLINNDSIEIICTVRSIAQTGVEMEALVGVTAALNTIWDMTKYIEKDEDGQYPTTKITDVRVLAKRKHDEKIER
ncbi:MAG: cyclic pyranopterin monophosphate synthase MoaC [Candidatus Hodarchaeota archaeon]